MDHKQLKYEICYHAFVLVLPYTHTHTHTHTHILLKSLDKQSSLYSSFFVIFKVIKAEHHTTANTNALVLLSQIALKSVTKQAAMSIWHPLQRKQEMFGHNVKWKWKMTAICASKSNGLNRAAQNFCWTNVREAANSFLLPCSFSPLKYSETRKANAQMIHILLAHLQEFFTPLHNHVNMWAILSTHTHTHTQKWYKMVEVDVAYKCHGYENVWA